MPCNYLVPHVLFAGTVDGSASGPWIHIGENKSVTLYIYARNSSGPSTLTLGVSYSPLPPMGKRVFQEFGGFVLDVDSAAVTPAVTINVTTGTNWSGMAIVDDVYNDQPYDFISMRIDVQNAPIPHDLIVIAVTSSR